MSADRPKPSSSSRASVAVSVDPEPLRAQLTARLDDAGLEVTLISPETAETHDYPVIVTSASPAPGASTNVVVYLPEATTPISVRLRTGQWLRLEDVDEVVGFIRQLVDSISPADHAPAVLDTSRPSRH